MVGDFGFAAELPPGTASAWPPGASPETAAPEIAASWGTPAATASFASDVYALGTTAFWLLAGRPAHDFSGARDHNAKMSIVAAHSPARLRDLAPHVPRYVCGRNRADDGAGSRRPLPDGHRLRRRLGSAAARLPAVAANRRRSGAYGLLARGARIRGEHLHPVSRVRSPPHASGHLHATCFQRPPGCGRLPRRPDAEVGPGRALDDAPAGIGVSASRCAVNAGRAGSAVAAGRSQKRSIWGYAPLNRRGCAGFSRRREYVSVSGLRSALCTFRDTSYENSGRCLDGSWRERNQQAPEAIASQSNTRRAAATDGSYEVNSPA
jgi:hypothetical protein